MWMQVHQVWVTLMAVCLYIPNKRASSCKGPMALLQPLLVGFQPLEVVSISGLLMHAIQLFSEVMLFLWHA